MSVPRKTEPSDTAGLSGGIRHPVVGELSRFTVVGILATLAYLVVANLLILIAGVDARVSSVAGYLVGMVISFLGQSRFTFRVRSTGFGHVWRFVVLSAIGLSISYFSVDIVETLLGLHPAWATVLTVGLVPLVSFAAMKLWVFATRE